MSSGIAQRPCSCIQRPTAGSAVNTATGAATPFLEIDAGTSFTGIAAGAYAVGLVTYLLDELTDAPELWHQKSYLARAVSRDPDGTLHFYADVNARQSLLARHAA